MTVMEAWSILSAPGATDTSVAGINDAGTVVGSYADASGVQHGYVYSGGTFTTVDDPQAAAGTALVGINDAGEVLGNYTDATGTHGFTATPGAGGSTATSAPQTIALTVKPPTGVAEDGYIAGALVFADTNQNGVLNPGEISTTTDNFGRFTLAGGSGPLVLTGGTDTATGLAFAGTMRAPAGYSVISPLTTLIAKLADTLGMSGAQQAVKTAFGLPGTANLARHSWRQPECWIRSRPWRRRSLMAAQVSIRPSTRSSLHSQVRSIPQPASPTI
jgi:probable HAF family extracellular repeat protein